MGEPCRWLSRHFGMLLREQTVAPADSPNPIDVLIIGSGYGGAVAAAELAGCRSNPTDGKALRICVLERGKEYLPGMFPFRAAELPGHIRFAVPGASEPMRARDGLFDLRLAGDVNVVLANGLGGGSLINAGVMEVPHPDVFSRNWPQGLRDAFEAEAAAAWQDAENHSGYFMRAKKMLGAANGQGANGIRNHAEITPQKPLAKHAAFARMSPDAEAEKSHFRDAAITVAMRDRVNSAGVALKACTLCGDCATGCNHGAKESLDTNLLALARQCGVEIYTGATVLYLARDTDGKGWLVYTTYTDNKQSNRLGEPVPLRAKRVILAAGSLGSTEILLRSQQRNTGLQFSPLLGQRFSTNGDMLATGYAQNSPVNAVASEFDLPAQRRVGPTITGIIDAQTEINGWPQRITLEELAVPGPLRRAFEEVMTTADTLENLGRRDHECHTRGPAKTDPFAINQYAIANSQLYAAMGDDGASGRIQLNKENPDAAVNISWPDAGKHPLFSAQIKTLKTLAEKAGLGGKILSNPVWQPLPQSMQFLMAGQQGPPTTVHPLGGCAIGAAVTSGVVDEFGQVFDAAAMLPDSTAGKFHEGLVVLDGAVIPGALGTNPALTIAAVALRAAEKLSDVWAVSVEDNDVPVDSNPLPLRPVWRDAGAAIATRRPVATVAEFTERLSGEVRLQQKDGSTRRCMLELTLCFEPKALLELVRDLPFGGQARMPELQVSEESGAANTSRLSIVPLARWLQIERNQYDPEQRDAAIREAELASAQLGGRLRVFDRDHSTFARRVGRSGWAWLRNRGLRDVWQASEQWLGLARHVHKGPGASLWERAKGALALATHAGEIRLFEYDLTLSNIECRQGFMWKLDGSEGRSLRGEKRITYARPSNPWQQLQRMTITGFPGLDERGAVLTLDPRYLVSRETPLFRIVQQEDQFEALSDLASLAGYFLRMLISLHVWNMRAPEWPVHEPQRLPGRIGNLPEPEITWLEVDRQGSEPVLARLTRYPAHNSDDPPVVMFHGYSASGTTFAHHAVTPNAAGYLWEQGGRDIWVVDMRSSCGLPSARQPWTFERVALQDVPAVIGHVVHVSGKPRVDVIAHCMGAAMVSMALLSAGQAAERFITPDDSNTGFADRFATARHALPQHVRRLVLSQVGPRVVFSPANIFRAYLMQYTQHFLTRLDYQFRPDPKQGMAAQLMDRLLATLPYPDEEFLLENPAWPPWRRTEYVGTRHRMDALYGRDFQLANLDRHRLEHIDDFFGPLNMRTVSQGIHLTRYQMVTNRAGRNRFLSRQAFLQNWPQATLSLHGDENGLADVATLACMRDEFSPLVNGINGTHRKFWQALPVPGYGHQDCWIGQDAALVFKQVENYLAKSDAAIAEDAENKPCADITHLPQIHAPAMGPTQGPVFITNGRPAIRFAVGGAPERGRAKYVAALPVGNLSRLASKMTVQRVRSRLWLWPVDAATPDWDGYDLPASVLQAAPDGLLVFMVYDPSGTRAEARSPGATSLPEKLAAVVARDEFAAGIAGQAARWIRNTPTQVLRLTMLQRPQPADAETSMSLALGSCQYPAGPLDVLPAYAAYRRLAERLDAGAPCTNIQPEVLVLAGDQIYADMSAGLFDPAQLDERYGGAYEKWLSQPAVRDVLRRLPLLSMLDDHEIDDNWEPGAPEDAFISEARSSYWHYQRQCGPFPKPEAAENSHNCPLWYRQTIADSSRIKIPMFVADTRTGRSRRQADNLGTASIMQADQFKALKSWLNQTELRNLPKIVVSPALVLPRHRQTVSVDSGQDGVVPYAAEALDSDTWDGFPASLYSLLAWIADNKIPNVVFLSGDEHLGMITRAALFAGNGLVGTPSAVVHSIHTSALYSPYPFANASQEDFLAEESFEFRPPAGGQHTDYQCRVTSTRFFPGCGFTLLRFAQTGTGRWQLDFEFMHEGERPDNSGSIML